MTTRCGFCAVPDGEKSRVSEHRLEFVNETIANDPHDIVQKHPACENCKAALSALFRGAMGKFFEERKPP